MTGERAGDAPKGARNPGWLRATLECGAIAAVGSASSLVIAELAMVLIGTRIPIVWQEVAALAVGNVVLAAWCLRRVRQRRCDPERRLHLAPVIGGTSVIATGVAFGVLTGTWFFGVLVVAWVSTFTGYLVWAMIYTGLVLWVLCRRAGHPRGHVRATPGAGEGGSTV